MYFIETTDRSPSLTRGHGPIPDPDRRCDDHEDAQFRLGTGISLVNQRDPMQTEKSVATIDQLSAGRFLFSIGNGRHGEEMGNHGTIVGLNPEKRDAILPVLDRWAEFMRQLEA
jgi:hypothetical protein